MVFMTAARVGEILANNERPVSFLQNNLTIELSTIAATFEAGVEKFALLGSSCIYPKFAA
nr:NAD-dependent epimerase/dehydratase family protein [Mesorhizobium sangaii]